MQLLIVKLCDGNMIIKNTSLFEALKYSIYYNV